MKYQQAFTECPYCKTRMLPVFDSDSITAVVCQNMECRRIVELNDWLIWNAQSKPTDFGSIVNREKD